MNMEVIGHEKNPMNSLLTRNTHVGPIKQPIINAFQTNNTYPFLHGLGSV